MALKSSCKTVYTINVDNEWFLGVPRKIKSKLWGTGQKGSYYGSTEQSKLHDFYKLSCESVQNDKWLPLHPQQLKIL